MWAVLECTSHYNEYERLDLLKCATHGPSRLLDNKLTLSPIFRIIYYKVARMFINVSISISISSSSASACIAVRNYQIDPTFLYYIVPGCPTTSYISGPYV